MSAMIQAVAGKTGMNPKEAKRFVKFLVVGIVGAVVDFGSYNILLTVFSATALADGGWMPTIAGTISFILAIISNFFWNRFWTYPDSRAKKIGTQFVQFFFVNFLAVLIRIPIIRFTHIPFENLTETIVPAFSAYAERIGNNLALALAVGIALFWNFFVNRYWTYSDVD
jgi:putative flippase GtrA